MDEKIIVGAPSRRDQCLIAPRRRSYEKKVLLGVGSKVSSFAARRDFQKNGLWVLGLRSKGEKDVLRFMCYVNSE